MLRDGTYNNYSHTSSNVKTEIYFNRACCSHFKGKICDHGILCYYCQTAGLKHAPNPGNQAVFKVRFVFLWKMELDNNSQKLRGKKGCFSSQIFLWFKLATLSICRTVYPPPLGAASSLVSPLQLRASKGTAVRVYVVPSPSPFSTSEPDPGKTSSRTNSIIIPSSYLSNYTTFSLVRHPNPRELAILTRPLLPTFLPTRAF